MKVLLKTLLVFFLILALFSSNLVSASEISVELTIPKIDSQPYHKPYIAVWLETRKRKGVHTLAFWHEQSDWFKDLRQWWRKIGQQKSPAYDQVTGATKKPGTYTVKIPKHIFTDLTLAPGEYFLNVEAVREEGGREFVRQKIVIGAGENKTYQKSGKHELGNVVINVMPSGLYHSNLSL